MLCGSLSHEAGYVMWQVVSCVVDLQYKLSSPGGLVSVVTTDSVPQCDEPVDNITASPSHDQQQRCVMVGGCGVA